MCRNSFLGLYIYKLAIQRVLCQWKGGGSTQYFFFSLYAPKIYNPYGLDEIIKEYYNKKDILKYYISSHLIDISTFHDLNENQNTVNGRKYLKAIYAAATIDYALRYRRTPETNIWAFVQYLDNGEIISYAIEKIRHEIDENASFHPMLSHKDISVERIPTIDAYINSENKKAKCYIDSYVENTNKFLDAESFFKNTYEIYKGYKHE